MSLSLGMGDMIEPLQVIRKVVDVVCWWLVSIGPSAGCQVVPGRVDELAKRKSSGLRI